MVQCDNCDPWYHYICVGLTAKQVQSMAFGCPNNWLLHHSTLSLISTLWSMIIQLNPYYLETTYYGSSIASYHFIYCLILFSQPCEQWQSSWRSTVRDENHAGVIVLCVSKANTPLFQLLRIIVVRFCCGASVNSPTRGRVKTCIYFQSLLIHWDHTFAVHVLFSYASWYRLTWSKVLISRVSRIFPVRGRKTLI